MAQTQRDPNKHTSQRFSAEVFALLWDLPDLPYSAFRIPRSAFLDLRFDSCRVNPALQPVCHHNRHQQRAIKQIAGKIVNG